MPIINTHPHFFLLLLSGILLFLVILFDKKYSMLKDESSAVKKPYSFSRVQLAWWSVIILASFITILFSKGVAPDFYGSTLILLGISSATMAAARLIDVSDKSNPKIPSMIQNQEGVNFFQDIMADANGVSIQRFQTVVVNIALGIWFFWSVWSNFSKGPDEIMPDISDNVLILLGLSSATYAALKTKENPSSPQKITPDPRSEKVPGKAINHTLKAEG